MTRPALVDTGPLVAILCPSDEHHLQCSAELRKYREPLLSCWPVITEAAWLVRKEKSGVKRLFDFVTNGIVQLVELDQAAPAWISTFMQRYASIGAQLADAALVYIANQRGLTDIFTTDRRDCSVYRLTNGNALRVIPE